MNRQLEFFIFNVIKDALKRFSSVKKTKNKYVVATLFIQ